jgi:hypothetical protein
MRLNIADINRINTCGILHKNKWDHNSKVDLDPAYSYGMREVFRWLYKRGGHIQYPVLGESLSRYHIKKKTPYENRAIYYQAFREFLDGIFHQNLSHIFIDYRTDLKVSKEDYLEYQIPVFSNHPHRPVFIYYEIGKEEKQFFLKRYEVMHNAVWSFYQLNKLPTFVNLWFENGKIQHETYKVDEEYILKAKRNLITVGKNLNIFVLPTIQTCKTCINIKDCERFSDKKKKRKTNG